MKKEYWNDIASKGAIVGALMLVSHIYEQWCIQNMSFGGIALMGIEMLVVLGVYIWLLYRFAKQASVKFGDDTLGFPYSQGVLYVVYTAIFAGIIVGFGHYVYIHFIVGYENYIEQMVENMQQMLRDTGGSASIMSMYDGVFSNMLEQPEPNIFSNIFSTICSYGFWGLLIGLFIAAGVKREPKLFDNGTNDAGDDAAENSDKE